jgi:hypothetical protein
MTMLSNLMVSVDTEGVTFWVRHRMGTEKGPVDERKESSSMMSSLSLGMKVISRRTERPALMRPGRVYLISKKSVMVSGRSRILKLLKVSDTFVMRIFLL